MYLIERLMKFKEKNNELIKNLFNKTGDSYYVWVSLLIKSKNDEKDFKVGISNETKINKEVRFTFPEFMLLFSSFFGVLYDCKKFHFDLVLYQD